MTNRKISKFLTFIFALLLFALSSCTIVEEPKEIDSEAVKEILENENGWIDEYGTFYRYDLDEMNIWNEELDKLRIFKEGWYELGEAKEKYNLDPTYVVSLEGLNELAVSASAQFSVNQFKDLATDLKEAAEGKNIVIVDLREESHGFINGIAISVYGLHNWGNLFLERNELQAQYEKYFANLVGTTITAYGRDDEIKLDEILELKVETVMSEKELVESEGFEYLHIACTDHVWPDAEEIDIFIEYVKNIDVENTWFHFHCAGGSGRTGAFLMIYDKMRNPHVSNKDILYRHSKTGSNYPLYLGDGDSYKDPLYKEKAELAPLIFEYIEQNHESNYEVSWSEWLEDRQ